ncbi:PTS fructose transporter subunit IIABC [Nocardioides iriomotensis]|uniref:PTS lactose transporter subunit IIC n=1 Tax=Nocardioides iriomotensis TaxID=715784 RepID=A0A4Q5J1H2_9ACTN|nr:fructose-specific PTS transporter subunit EIIC [Nocardioides iriomotensis]RYU12410.1 PTS lactose transporter subunit IIC [Nocardioides iriomotensis]
MTASTPMITEELVRLDVSLGADKTETIRGLARLAADAGRTGNADGLAADALAREATSSTGLPGGIAIPHCRTEHVDVPTLVFARLEPGTDFGAKDGPADLAFLIAAPAGGDATHLEVLTQLARALVRPEFTDGLRQAETPADVVSLVDSVVKLPAPAAAPAGAAPAAAAAAEPAPAARRSIVAVTACPTGIAHTYMAAEALEAAAARAGVDIHVETQGSAGSTPLSRDTIHAASAAIFAADVGVRERGRFAGLPVVASGVKRAIDDGDAMIAEALRFADDPNAPRVEGTATAGDSSSTGEESWGLRIRRVLMTGVSYMIPFVAAGGLLIALSFLLGGYTIVGPGQEIATTNSLFNLPDLQAAGLEDALFDSPLMAYLGAVLFTLGGTAFSFLVPALAGYIAYAIADRPGIAPGFVMGAIAVIVNSGFLGGIVGGVLGGLVAHWIASWKVPVWMRGLMPVVVIPLLATMISGAVMLIVLAKPLGALMSALRDGLNSLSGGSAIILGVVLGLMMAFDMGGPLNKTAYTFATGGLTAAAVASGDAPELTIMASVMLAGMVPPLALALATVVRPKLFNVAERENGKAAWLLGASFITEGAIPFAAADPARVIPSIMAGSAVTGALSMAFGVTLSAPHGGIFVFFAVGHVFYFFLSLLIGVLVAAGLVILLKSLSHTDAEEVTATA